MEPTGDAIRVQLDRILSSESFASSDRLSRFLRYIVERALAGEGDRLKEYVIGTEVFERGEQYDPRVDSIVRVEAGRLRVKLEDYYNRLATNDAVMIRVPRGSYAPVFESRRTAVATPPRRLLPLAGAAAAVVVVVIAAWGSGFWAAAESPNRGLTIAVLPFSNYSTEETAALLAARVTDGVTSELARVGTVGVVSHTSALQFAGVRKPLREVAQALNADIVMEGTVEINGDSLRVMARLVDASRDRKFWAEEFAGSKTDVRDIQRRIAVAAAEAATSARR